MSSLHLPFFKWLAFREIFTHLKSSVLEVAAFHNPSNPRHIQWCWGLDSRMVSPLLLDSEFLVFTYFLLIYYNYGYYIVKYFLHLLLLFFFSGTIFSMSFLLGFYGCCFMTVMCVLESCMSLFYVLKIVFWFIEYLTVFIYIIFVFFFFLEIILYCTKMVLLLLQCQACNNSRTLFGVI